MNDIDNLPERLRTALRAVAELPPPDSAAAAGPEPPEHPARFRTRPRLLTTVVAVAAAAALVSLLLAYGPGNTGGRSTGNAKAPATTPTSLPATTVPGGIGIIIPGSPGTEQLIYQPFAGSEVDPTIHVSSRQSGPCFAYGGGADDRSYYRCGTLQPCVAGPDGTAAPLVCPIGADPASGTVILWTATSVDTTGLVPATTQTPFAMELSNGVVCSLVSAAWSGLGPFSCADDSSVPGGSSFPADCHAPLASAQWWTADCQAQVTGTSPFTSTRVEKVWF